MRSMVERIPGNGSARRRILSTTLRAVPLPVPGRTC